MAVSGKEEKEDGVVMKVRRLALISEVDRVFLHMGEQEYDGTQLQIVCSEGGSLPTRSHAFK